MCLCTFISFNKPLASHLQAALNHIISRLGCSAVATTGEDNLHGLLWYQTTSQESTVVACLRAPSAGLKTGIAFPVDGLSEALMVSGKYNSKFLRFAIECFTRYLL